MHKLRALAWPLGQPLSRLRNFLRQSWLFHRFRHRHYCGCPSLRSGVNPQAAFSSSSSSNASSKAPSLHGRYPLLHYYGPLRLPARADPLVMYSLGPSGFRLHSPALPGLPGSSTDLFLRAVPNHPGRPDKGPAPVIPSPVAGFTILGRLAVLQLTSRGRIRFAFVTARRFASRGFVRLDCSSPRSLGYMLNG